MHKSRLATIVIDCQTQHLDDAARFFSAALGRLAGALSDPSDANYRDLAGPPEEIKVLAGEPSLFGATRPEAHRRDACVSA